MANTSSHSVGVLVRPPPLAKAQVSRMDTGGPRFRLRTKTSGFGAPPTAEAAPSAIVQTPADEEEAQVSPAAHLLQLMQGEVARALSLLQLAPSAFRPAHGDRCPLCPWLQPTPRDGPGVLLHLQASHGPATHFVASGTKQVRVCMALFETDVFLGRLQGDYLSRSAETLRGAVQPQPGPRVQMIDRHVRVVLDGTGPVLVGHLASTAMPLRRVGNVLYTREFGDVLLRDLLISRDGLAASMNRLQSTFLLAGNKLGRLMPEHPKTMWPVVADILKVRAVTTWIDALVRSALDRGEFRVVSCDGTMKVAMGLMGYRRDRGLVGPEPAWTEHERRTRILTLRGTTGFLIGMPLVRDEAGSTIAAALSESCPTPDHREAVQFLVVDVCNAELQQQMLAKFP